MNGLHSCKPGNEPTVGETKNFSIEQRIGKSGKPWTKIKADREGQPYRVVKATKTDFTDDHGNVSFNLEIEPSNGTQSTPIGPQTSLRPLQGDDRSNRIERQHSQHMALLYLAMRPDQTVQVSTETVRSLIDWFQRDVGRSPVKEDTRREEDPGDIAGEPPPPDEEESF